MVLRTPKSRRWYFANTDIFRKGSPSEIQEEMGSRQDAKLRKRKGKNYLDENDSPDSYIPLPW